MPTSGNAKAHLALCCTGFYIVRMYQEFISPVQQSTHSFKQLATNFVISKTGILFVLHSNYSLPPYLENVIPV